MRLWFSSIRAQQSSFSTLNILLRASAAGLAIGLPVSPVWCASATTTGIIAGVGLNAATGKTTVSNNGGVIEAALLNSQSVLKAGKAIRLLALAAAAQEPQTNRILILGHADSLDFATARALQVRLDNLLNHTPVCHPKVASQSSGKNVQFEALNLVLPTPSLTDIPAIAATDTTIQGISLSTDDRLLAEAVMIGGSPYGYWRNVDDLLSPKSLPTVGDMSNTRFSIPADAADFDPAKSPLIIEYKKLGELAATLAECDSVSAKAWLADVKAFQSSVTGSDKGPAALGAAAELLAMTEKGALVLRVAVEQTGGTAITRSNIFYTLGWPGAATVSAGFLASFRLSDPVKGTDLLAGFVRCAVTPTRFQDVRKIVAADQQQLLETSMSCSVITT